MQLSKRMSALANMVSPGLILADIGTDHGYLPVWLIRTGKIPRAVAADVNEGPLSRARKTVQTYHLEDVIHLRLSDGLENLSEGEVECILIAGMGGMLTLRILQNGTEKLRQVKELVLQPQSDIQEVRAWADRSGWEIAREDLVEEDGKFYPMMQLHPAKPGCLEQMNELQLRYGPRLLQEGHPVLKEYLQKEKTQLLQVESRLAGSDGSKAKERLAEIRSELWMNEEAARLLASAPGKPGESGRKEHP